MEVPIFYRLDMENEVCLTTIKSII